MAKLREAFRSRFVRQVGVLVGASLLTQIIPFLLSPFLTRLFTPADFGLVALYVAIVNILSPLVTGRYELAIVLPRSSRQAISLLSIAIALAFVINIMLFLGLLIGFGAFHSMIQQPEYWLFLFLPLSIFLTASLQALNYWLNRQQRYYPMSVSNTSQRLLTVLLSIVFGVVNLKGGLLCGQIAGKALTPILLIKVLAEAGTRAKRCFSLKWWFFLIKRYRRFPLYSAPSSLLNAVSTESPILLLALFFRQAELGLYALSVRVLMLPVSVLSRNIGQVFLSRAQQLNLSPFALTRVLTGKLLLIAFPIFGLLVLIGPQLFAWFFGAPWYVAGEYAQWMSFWLFYVFLAHPLSMLLIVQEKQDKGLLFDGILLGVRIAAVLIGALWFHSVMWTVALFAGLGGFVWLCYAAYLLKLAEQHYRFIALALLLPLGMLCCLLILNRQFL